MEGSSTMTEIEFKKVKKIGGKWHVVHCTGPDAGKPIEGSKGYSTEEEAEEQHRAIEARKHGKSYTFYSDGEFEVKSETEGGEEEYYLTGYISSNQRDLAGDVVTDSAIKGMVEQLNSGNVKVDIEHEVKFKPGQNPPFGRIIEGKEEVIDDVKKIWVKVHLNKNYPNFKSKLQEIKQKFLNAFSIAFFKPKLGEYIEEVKNNVKTRFLNVIKLVNVGITGLPENPDCDIIGVVSKSLHDIDVDEKSLEGVMKWVKEQGSGKSAFDKISGELRGKPGIADSDALTAWLQRKAGTYEHKSADSKSKNIEKMAGEGSEEEAEIKSLEDKFKAEIKSLRDEIKEKAKQIDDLVELKATIDEQKTTIDTQAKQIDELQKKSVEHGEQIDAWMKSLSPKAFVQLSKDMLAELGVTPEIKSGKGKTMLQSIPG